MLRYALCRQTRNRIKGLIQPKPGKNGGNSVEDQTKQISEKKKEPQNVHLMDKVLDGPVQKRQRIQSVS